MAAIPELIYCADGNRRFAEIAIDAGFLYGAQLPNTVYYPPYFADQNWKEPDFDRYMAALAEHRPHIASVIDWEREEQLPEVSRWAESAAQFIDVVVVIPKVIGGVGRIPATIGNKPVRLGYSVPTRFGGTEVPAWEFGDRPVHLLGGRPEKQRELSHYLNVISADGNYAGMKALRFCQYFDGVRWVQHNGHTKNDVPYACFERSCKNIMRMWHSK